MKAIKINELKNYDDFKEIFSKPLKLKVFIISNGNNNNTVSIITPYKKNAITLKGRKVCIVTNYGEKITRRIDEIEKIEIYDID